GNGVSRACPRLPGARTGDASRPVDMTLYVNGRDYRLRLEPRRTLLDALRVECGLTGTHIGCENGAWGACTVLLEGSPFGACLMFAVQAQGGKIRTVEGLAAGGDLTPLQEAFIRHQAGQCGFCTTGFRMRATAILEHDPDITD